MITTKDVKAVFDRLECAAIRPPWKTPRVMAGAPGVYAQMLEGITPAELHHAAHLFLKGGSNWWPTPGQLLELVPDYEESLKARSRWLQDAGSTTRLTTSLLHKLADNEDLWCATWRLSARAVRHYRRRNGVDPYKLARVDDGAPGDVWTLGYHWDRDWINEVMRPATAKIVGVAGLQIEQQNNVRSMIEGGDFEA